MTMLRVINTQPEYSASVAAISYCEDPDDGSVFTAQHIRQHIQRFPEGQFVALWGEQVVGYAVTLRTHRSPNANPLPWLDAIGGMGLAGHKHNGSWLYGVDFYVHPDFRRKGIGSALYQARFQLIKELKLKGFYAGGILAGYHRYYGQMSVREYAARVKRREINDPTITMQMNRGFKAQGVIENYYSGLPQYTSAMLIVWDTPSNNVQG